MPTLHLSPPPLSLSVSPSLFSYSLNSCCVSLFVIFVLFFHLAPCDKIFACLRTSWPSCFPGFSFPSLPSARSPPQSLSQSVSQQASVARDDRSEACACPGPFSGWASLPALLGSSSPVLHKESGTLWRRNPQFSLLRKFCYAAANLQQLP